MIRKIKDRAKETTIKAIDKVEELSKSVSKSMKCSACDGKGVVGSIRKTPCQVCGGTGTVVGKVGESLREKLESDSDK